MVSSASRFSSFRAFFMSNFSISSFSFLTFTFKFSTSPCNCETLFFSARNLRFSDSISTLSGSPVTRSCFSFLFLAASLLPFCQYCFSISHQSSSFCHSLLFHKPPLTSFHTPPPDISRSITNPFLVTFRCWDRALFACDNDGALRPCTATPACIIINQ